VNQQRKWLCDGVPKDGKEYQNVSGKHDPCENSGPDCVQCGLPREAMNPTKEKKGAKILGLVISVMGRWRVPAIVVVVMGSVVSGLAYWQRSKCPPGEQKVGNACLAVTPHQSNSPPIVTQILGTPGNKRGPTDPSRYSSGERRLLRYQANLDGDRGTQAFSAGNYQRASEFFAKAVRGDRRDPEVQIYLNNAKARLKGKPFTLATVVPVDSAATSAEEMLRGVADAQTKFNDAGGFGDRLLEVVIANDGNDSSISGGVARKLANNPAILGVVGHNASSASQGALGNLWQSEEFSHRQFPGHRYG